MRVSCVLKVLKMVHEVIQDKCWVLPEKVQSKIHPKELQLRNENL